jgi:AraC family transcriptional regulator
MRVPPLPGPDGLYTVSVMPRFLLDSRQIGWQGAYFTDIHGAAEGTVDHGHQRCCIQRGMHQETRRALGAREWRRFSAGFSVWRQGDEQRFDWRHGGRSQFLFVAPEVVAMALGDTHSLAPVGQREPVHSLVLESIFNALQADLSQGSPAGPLVGEALVTALLAHISGLPQPHALAPASRACARAVDLIEARFAHTVTLQDLSDAAGVGPRQLCRAFREGTGMSPHQYLLRCRIEHAKHLIGRGLALTEVALSSGFADQSQLTRTFVRHVGTTPGRYRSGGGR